MKKGIKLLTEYVSLIIENERTWELWSATRDKTDNMESMILSLFGLPKTPKYMYDLNNLLCYENPEKEIESIAKKMERFAFEYLNSKPETNLILLENAKIKGLKAEEILPLIGVNNNIYTHFIYDEIFLKGIECTANTLSILKREDLYESLLNLHFYVHGALKHEKEIDTSTISYFNEYLAYDPD